MAKKELTYSLALAELESIVEAIEGDRLDVDALSERVKRAAELLAFCRAKLRATEEEVERIIGPLE